MNRQSHISACPLDCFGVCSFKITSENGSILSLEPNEENPVTGNLICKKGRSHLARMNDPDRILEPMQRTPAGWEPISWDAAMDFMAQKITACIETDGHHSIASYFGGGAAGKLKGAMELFFRHLGGGTVFSGGLCWAAGIEAQTLDFGKVLSHSPEDLLSARTLVFWGKNPADTHFHLLPWVTKARKNGCQVILIDPITSATSSFADRVIRPMPGTDWALALAVIHGILSRQLEDKEAFAAISAKQPLLLESIGALNTTYLLRHCGVSEEELQLLIDAYGFRKPCATYMGYGMQRYETGGSSIRIIDLLAILTGQVGIPGGGANYANKANSGLFDWSWAEPAFPPDARSFQQGNMGPDILGASEPPVKLMFIACANPAVQMPDTTMVAKALKSVETVIVIDHFMTDTAAMADLVLPATYFLEEENIISSGMWNSAIHYTPQIVEPRGQARSELRIFSELARRLNLTGFPQLSEIQWIENLIRPLNKEGITLNQIKEKGWVLSPVQKAIPWENGEFSTADGSFNPIEQSTVENLLITLNPHLDDTLPLISFHRRDSINSQHTRNLGETFPEAMMNPDTAEHFGITAGDPIVLTSQSGSLKAVAVLETIIRPGIVALTQGAWKYEDRSINDLSPSGVSDIGGQALLNGGRVSISKV